MRAAQQRCISQGVDPSVFDNATILQPQDCTEIDMEQKSLDVTSNPINMLLSGKYTVDGYWPPLRPDMNRGDGLRRPATGYDRGIPAVVDRIFSSPLAKGTSEKHIRRVKEEMNRRTFVTRRSPHDPVRASSADDAKSSEYEGKMDKEVESSGLTTTANIIFSENEKSVKLQADNPLNKHIQKLSYAEKLQMMIMQVQDEIRET